MPLMLNTEHFRFTGHVQEWYSTDFSIIGQQ